MSDVESEEFIKESINTIRFLAIDVNQTVSDYSILSRFIIELVAKKAYDRFLQNVNKQLWSKKIKINSVKVIV